MEAFIDLLRRYEIELLIDTRSSPYSRYSPQFNREVLSEALRVAKVSYLFLGEGLGGRPGDPAFYDSQGYVRYDRIAESAAFEQALQRLLQVSGNARSAILCSEEDPTDCHRRRLVSKVLESRGVEILHIRGDGRLQTEAEIKQATCGDQPTLFALDQGSEWKSTRSVLDKKTRQPSSES